MVAIVDYGMGNLHSVRHALEMVGADVVMADHPEALLDAERILLPGVGTFPECVRNLRASGLVEVLDEQVRQKGKPLLGICLGMQVLAREGFELGRCPGLGWLPAVVTRLEAGPGLKVPHVGWNEILPEGGHPLFAGLGRNASFYFVHSYRLVPEEPGLTIASCDYGIPFTAAVARDTVVATQFHPEKSQQNGLRLLENFLVWKP
jgi:glutamine amidotransferase